MNVSEKLDQKLEQNHRCIESVKCIDYTKHTNNRECIVLKVTYNCGCTQTLTAPKAEIVEGESSDFESIEELYQAFDIMKIRTKG